MSAPNDGGPVQGMTLRDWFAGKATAAMIQRDGECSKFDLLEDDYKTAKEYDEDGRLVYAHPPSGDLCEDSNHWLKVAQSSYAMADAMLAAREGRKP